MSRERVVIGLLHVLGAIFYVPIWVVTKVLEKLSKEGPGWGD